jgi:multidrug efflux system membrane fusion protein
MPNFSTAMPFSPARHEKELFASLAAITALAGLISVGLSGCDSKAKEVPPAAPGAVISAAAVIERAVTETQEFSGRLEAIERVEIRARVGGFITEVKVQPGGLVRKGDVLFVIDPRPYQVALDQSAASAAAAHAKAELAKIALTRAEKLLVDRAIAQRELDENASGFKELDANARAAGAQQANAKLNLSYTQVTAPIDGRVSKAEITLGNLIDPTTILTSIVSDDRIYASFDGDEDTFLRVGAAARKGQAVAVKVGLANETGFPHQGKLEFVDNQLDPLTGGVRMRALFANTDKILVPGLFARVQVQGGNGTARQSTALLINERAVGTDQSKKFVYLIGADNKAEYRAVTLGPSIDGLRVVQNGLKAGDKIVVNGLQRVHRGAQLAPHMVAMDFDPDAPTPEAKPADGKAAKAAVLPPAKR